MELANVARAVLPGVISLALVVAILSPRVRDGIVIKVGLCAMSLGFGAITMRWLFRPWNIQMLEAAIAMVEVGAVVAVLGYVWRTRRAGHPLRRSTDWGLL
jgi:hypothetical protein